MGLHALVNAAQLRTETLDVVSNIIVQALDIRAVLAKGM
jgi:hypothetical protein